MLGQHDDVIVALANIYLRFFACEGYVTKKEFNDVFISRLLFRVTSVLVHASLFSLWVFLCNHRCTNRIDKQADGNFSLPCFCFPCRKNTVYLIEPLHVSFVTVGRSSNRRECFLCFQVSHTRHSNHHGTPDTHHEQKWHKHHR